MARDHRPKETYTEFGIVLKNSPLGESDAILTLLLEGRGKISALARGIKRSRRQFMGGLDIFDSAKFSIEERGNDDRLPLLAGISEKRSFETASRGLTAFAAASVALEVTGHLALERDPEGGLYIKPLQHCLECVDNGESIEVLVRFLTELLSRTGFGDFESISLAHPEVTPWLRGAGDKPDRQTLLALLANILCSVELIIGKGLTTRKTAERFLLVS